mgnify:CR=1 FL=1|tara:strand:+ start:2537 stop:2992 length:456 start_codon:yes stop_codon:yes gene_type:complete
MKIAFIYGKKPSSILTKLFTGSTCYHVGFTDGFKFWDMNLIRRRRIWSGLYPSNHCILVDSPVPISSEYLDYMLDTDYSTYGWRDYLLFALRPIYHLLGKSTRNSGGVICSEMIFHDLNANGWDQLFIEVPSPADLEFALLGRKDAINVRG